MSTPKPLSFPLKGYGQAKNDPQVTIYWKHDHTSKAEPVGKPMSKRHIGRYSTGLKDLLTEGKNSYVIVGGPKAPYVTALEWIRDSPINGHGKEIGFLTVYQHFRVIDVATQLGISVLEHRLQKRVQSIAAKQISVEDVRAIYKWYPEGSDARKVVVESIGDAIWERRLRSGHRYRQFREENTEYCEEISAYLDGLRAPIREAEKKAKAVEWKRYRQEKKERAKASKALWAEKQERKTVHKTIQGVQGRELHDGKHWVRLTLKDLEVKYDVPGRRKWVQVASPN